MGCKAGFLILMLGVTMFYLNYVGCKETWTDARVCRNRGFTLTMWDVKGNILDSILRKVEVLP